MEKLKVAMIGGFTSVAGFKAVGVETYPVASPQDGPAVWDALPRDRYAVVMITEPVYEVLLERIAGFPRPRGPAGGTRGACRQRLHRSEQGRHQEEGGESAGFGDRGIEGGSPYGRRPSEERYDEQR